MSSVQYYVDKAQQGFANTIEGLGPVVAKADQRFSSAVQGAGNRIANLVQPTVQSVEQDVSNWWEKQADNVWARYQPKAEQTVSNIVDQQVKKYTPWIVLLYVLVGLAVLFSVLGFIKVSQLRRMY
jgi:hypothetical protein